MSDRRILVNAFDMSSPTHLVSGTWKHPESQAWRYKELGYWTDLARLLERGLFDGLFIADVIGVYDVYAGGPEAALRPRRRAGSGQRSDARYLGDGPRHRAPRLRGHGVNVLRASVYLRAAYVDA
jgi:alkanesulfonate monooxygenase SsuD/methylene tetrahydromethanopterin reductase-like flavin-dependent oxidoreductase (luciferase family)